MQKVVAITRKFWETKVALLEDDKLTELLVQKEGKRTLRGNIYKGLVKRKNYGLEALYIDLGDCRRLGFLNMKTQATTLMSLPKEDSPEELEETIFPISFDEIRENQALMVQVVREPEGDKGPRLSLNITLPGKYFVLLPLHPEKKLFSRRIPQEEREKLLEKVEKVLKESELKVFGFIIRHEALEATEEELREDFDFLKQLWASIKTAYEKKRAPSLLYREEDILKSAFRDIITADVSKIYVDTLEDLKLLRNWFKSSPLMKEKIEYYTGSIPLFDELGITSQIKEILSRKIPLKNGFLVVDETEALTVIDVNTGSNTAADNFEESVFQTNLQAAEEIARILRVRNIGGIVIIDFIDMKEEEHRQAVLEKLKECTARDRHKVVVVGMTPLGLVELTRKKWGPSLTSMTMQKCPVCHGEGKVISADEILLSIAYHLNKVKDFFRTKEVEVLLSPFLYNYVTSRISQNLLNIIKKETGLTVRLEIDESLGIWEHKIRY